MLSPLGDFLGGKSNFWNYDFRAKMYIMMAT